MGTTLTAAFLDSIPNTHTLQLIIEEIIRARIETN